MELLIGQFALSFFDRFDEVVGQGPVIGPSDIGIGGRLGIPTAGDQQLLNVGIDDIALSLPSSGSFSQLTTKRSSQFPAGLGSHQIERARKEPFSYGSIRRSDGAGVCS